LLRDKEKLSARIDNDKGLVAYFKGDREIVKLHLLGGDNRTSMILRGGGISQGPVMSTWHMLIDLTNPALIMDVGANHGEISLSLVPPPDAKVILFEPNPYLCEVLGQSIATHAHSSQFMLHQAALSEAAGRAIFHIDRKWSGTSSLDFKAPDARYKGGGVQTHEDVEVQIDTIDALAGVHARSGRAIAIKIDVEGHEPKVLAGGRDTLSSHEFFTILEFSDKHLKESGFDTEEFVASLLSIGRLFQIRNHGSFRAVKKGDLKAGTHCDLVLTNHPGVIAALTRKLPTVAV
jgi:FkbM family methyltransferase